MDPARARRSRSFSASFRPPEARTEIFGRDSQQVASREAVGFLPENPYFYKYLTGAETLCFYGKLCGLRGAKLRSRIDELLDLVGLTSARDRRLGELLQRNVATHRPRPGARPGTASWSSWTNRPPESIQPARAKSAISFSISNSAALPSCFRRICSGRCRRFAIASGFSRNGVLVREGALSDLLAIENQTDVVLENASPELLSAD